MKKKKTFYVSTISAEMRLSLESKLQGKDDRLLPAGDKLQVGFFLVGMRLLLLQPPPSRLSLMSTGKFE